MEKAKKSLLLVCGNARFHKAKWLTVWIETEKEGLHLELLPALALDENGRVA